MEEKNFNYKCADTKQKNFEPKFKKKVKYASCTYNVLEVKDIAGVTYYGIEDEPNHIDYVQAENCERVDGYSIKESGAPFPTKPAKFSEQNSWSEEDEEMIGGLNNCLDELEKENGWRFTYVNNKNVELVNIRNWLKSIKDRVQPKKQSKPSEEQPEDIVVIAKTFLDALSKTPYNNKPITDAQITVKQLILFFENPKEYNPDAILE